MMQKLIQLLPTGFTTETGDLSSMGAIVGLSLWTTLFLVAGLAIGFVYCRKSRRAVISLEKENLKGFNRLEIYRATVEKQSDSELFRN